MKSEILEWHAELDSADVEPHPAFTIYPGSAALLIVDMQKRLGDAMPEKVWKRSVQNTRRLVAVAKELDLPILVTEQYPKGLGSTVPEIAEVLPDDAVTIEKTDFSCAHLPEVRRFLERHSRRQLLVVGQETHVCVFQSVRHFVERGWFCHVLFDAVLSRGKENWRIGLRLMDSVGATITSTETVLFDLVKGSEHPAFKTVSSLVK